MLAAVSAKDRDVLFVRDVSRYGTFLNKIRIPAQTDTSLEEGDVLTIGDGDTRMEIRWDAASAPAEPPGGVLVPSAARANVPKVPADGNGVRGGPARARRDENDAHAAGAGGPPAPTQINNAAPGAARPPGAPAGAAAAAPVAACGPAAGAGAAAAAEELAKVQRDLQALQRSFMDLERHNREALKEKSELQAKLSMIEIAANGRVLPERQLSELFHSMLESCACFLDRTNAKPAAGLVEALASQLQQLLRLDSQLALGQCLECLIALKARGVPGFDESFVSGGGVEALLSMMDRDDVPLELHSLGAMTLAIMASSIKALQRVRAWPGLEALRGKFGPATDATPEIAHKMRELFDKTDTGPRDEVSDYMERELSAIVGLGQVKEQMRRMLKAIRLNERRRLAGIEVTGQRSHNMVLIGNPGTGKTTVARLLAQLFYKIGLTKKDVFIEASREDLVAGYVGQTAIMTKAVVDRAQGGVLFIDEAYRLSQGGKKDFGKEAIETLMTEMTKQDSEDGGIIFIFAGYETEMSEFRTVNPGLARRIAYTFTFEDYSTDELVRIAVQKVAAKNFKLAPGVAGELASIITRHFSKDECAKHNGGLAARMVDAAVEHLNMRLDVDSGSIDTLVTLTAADFAEGAAKLRASWWE